MRLHFIGCYDGCMLDHHLQREIIHELAFVPAARFSELKPDDIENKLFTYHLQKVIKAGYVEKAEDGTYSLTAEGRRLGLQLTRSERYTLEKAYSALFLIIRRKSNGAWLFCDRNLHPLLGYTALPVATPDAALTAVEVAARDLKAKTGLDGTFKALGGGFYHLYKDGELESYTNFTLMICEDASGELQQLDTSGTYEWLQDPDFTDKRFLPTTKRLTELYQAGEAFFLEEIADI